MIKASPKVPKIINPKTSMNATLSNDIQILCNTYKVKLEVTELEEDSETVTFTPQAPDSDTDTDSESTPPAVPATPAADTSSASN